MLINKNKYNISNDKKILHKIGKRWVTVSALTLALLGGGALAGNVATHADTVQGSKVAQTTVIKNRINNDLEKAQQKQKLGASKPLHATKSVSAHDSVPTSTVHNHARTLHSRILAVNADQKQSNVQHDDKGVSFAKPVQSSTENQKSANQPSQNNNLKVVSPRDNGVSATQTGSKKSNRDAVVKDAPSNQGDKMADAQKVQTVNSGNVGSPAPRTLDISHAPRVGGVLNVSSNSIGTPWTNGNVPSHENPGDGEYASQTFYMADNIYSTRNGHKEYIGGKMFKTIPIDVSAKEHRRDDVDHGDKFEVKLSANPLERANQYFAATPSDADITGRYGESHLESSNGHKNYAIYNYNAKQGANVNVKYVNQVGKNVASDTISGGWGYSGSIQSDSKLTMPNGYNFTSASDNGANISGASATSVPYKISSTPQNITVHVTGKNVTEPVNYVYSDNGHNEIIGTGARKTGQAGSTSDITTLPSSINNSDGGWSIKGNHGANDYQFTYGADGGTVNVPLSYNAPNTPGNSNNEPGGNVESDNIPNPNPNKPLTPSDNPSNPVRPNQPGNPANPDKASDAKDTFYVAVNKYNGGRFSGGYLRRIIESGNTGTQFFVHPSDFAPSGYNSSDSNHVVDGTINSSNLSPQYAVFNYNANDVTDNINFVNSDGDDVSDTQVSGPEGTSFQANTLTAPNGYNLTNPSQSITYDGQDHSVAVQGKSVAPGTPIPFNPNSPSNHNNGNGSSDIPNPNPNKPWTPSDNPSNPVKPNQPGNPATPKNPTDANRTFYVGINKYSNGSFVGGYMKRFVENGNVGDTFSITPNDFTPVNYSATNSDSAVDGMINTNGLSRNYAIYNYDADSAKPITVNYVNQSGDKVQSDTLNGSVDQKGVVNSLPSTVSSQGYSLNSNVNYTLSATPQTINVNVTGAPTTETVHYMYKGSPAQPEGDSEPIKSTISGKVGDHFNVNSLPAGLSSNYWSLANADNQGIISKDGNFNVNVNGGIKNNSGSKNVPGNIPDTPNKPWTPSDNPSNPIKPNVPGNPAQPDKSNDAKNTFYVAVNEFNSDNSFKSGYIERVLEQGATGSKFSVYPSDYKPAGYNTEDDHPVNGTIEANSLSPQYAVFNYKASNASNDNASDVYDTINYVDSDGSQLKSFNTSNGVEGQPLSTADTSSINSNVPSGYQLSGSVPALTYDGGDHDISVVMNPGSSSNPYAVSHYGTINITFTNHGKKVASDMVNGNKLSELQLTPNQSSLNTSDIASFINSPTGYHYATDAHNNSANVTVPGTGVNRSMNIDVLGNKANDMNGSNGFNPNVPNNVKPSDLPDNPSNPIQPDKPTNHPSDVKNKDNANHGYATLYLVERNNNQNSSVSVKTVNENGLDVNDSYSINPSNYTPSGYRADSADHALTGVVQSNGALSNGTATWYYDKIPAPAPAPSPSHPNTPNKPNNPVGPTNNNGNNSDNNVIPSNPPVNPTPNIPSVVPSNNNSNNGNNNSDLKPMSGNNNSDVVITNTNTNNNGNHNSDHSHNGNGHKNVTSSANLFGRRLGDSLNGLPKRLHNAGKIGNINQLDSLPVGYYGDYKGVIVAPISLKNHYRYFKNIKQILAHKNPVTIGHGEKGAYAISRKNNTDITISHYFVLKFRNGAKWTVYQFGHKGQRFATTNPHFVENAYLQHHNFRHTRKLIRVTRGCYEYSSRHYSRKTRVRAIRKGMVLPVKRVRTIGRGQFTRLLLTNGRWVTANRNYVHVIK